MRQVKRKKARFHGRVRGIDMIMNENIFDKNIDPGFRQEEERSLGRRAVQGGIWVFTLKIIQRVLDLIRIVLLARLLSPTDFGLMGIAFLAINMLEMFSRTGIESALIQKKENIREHLDTAWTIQLARSLVLFALIFLGAPLIAGFFRNPQALLVIRVLAFLELFRGAKNIGTVYFTKELRFDKGFILNFSGLAANMAVSITLAFILRNVWALVYGALSGAFVIFVMSYVLQPYKPRIRFAGGKAKELLNFGKWLLGSSILGFCLTQGDDAFIGRLLGITALGFYQMAYRLSNAPATEITNVMSRVTFPIYSKIQNDIPRLRKAYLDVLQLTTFLSFPMAGLIFVLAPDFTRIFLGEKWMPMVMAMQMLCIFGLIRSIEAIAGPLFQAIGKPSIIVKLQLVKLLLLVIMIYPLTKHFGIAGTALTIILSNGMVTPFTNLLAMRSIRAKVMEFLKPLLFFAAATVFAALFIRIVKGFVLVQRFDIIMFFILAAAGLALYYFLIWGIYRFLGYKMPTKVIADYL